MKSNSVSRRQFLGSSAALGILATAPGLSLKAGGFEKVSNMNKELKITKIETIPLSLPVAPFKDGIDKLTHKLVPPKYYDGDPYQSGRNRNSDGHLLMNYVLVKVYTDGGIVGFGDAPTDAVETVEIVKFTIDRYMAPKLIGRNPFAIEPNKDLITKRSNGIVLAHHASAAINYALYDILGKALNVPLYTLLGGLYQNKVLASIEVPGGTPEEMAAHSLEL